MNTFMKCPIQNLGEHPKVIDTKVEETFLILTEHAPYLKVKYYKNKVDCNV